MEPISSSGCSTFWELEAKRLVQYVSTQMMDAHRGAMPWHHPRVVVVFGNDGYDIDDRAKQEVEALRRIAERDGLREFAFATDGYSWVLIVEFEEGFDDVWNSLVWNVWPGGMCEVQFDAAARAIERSGLKADGINN